MGLEAFYREECSKKSGNTSATSLAERIVQPYWPKEQTPCTCIGREFVEAFIEEQVKAIEDLILILKMAERSI